MLAHRIVLALWTGLVWSEPVRGDGLAVSMALSRTAELDVNLWSAPPDATITFARLWPCPYTLST